VDESGRHGLDELRTLQDFTLRYAIGQVPGVAEVASVGGYQKQYQVTVDPTASRAWASPCSRSSTPCATPTATSAAACWR
jgi:Cu(I)/Ag(I) efflux system membrane protein CusA/SilA